MQIIVRKHYQREFYIICNLLKPQTLGHTELSEKDELNLLFVDFFFGKALIISFPQGCYTCFVEV